MEVILNFIWAIACYLFSVFWASFLTMMIFLPFVLVAMVLQKITDKLYLIWAEILGHNSWQMISAPGVVIHESAHVFFCLIFRHKIHKIKLFTMSEDDCLGYVEHSCNPESLYQRIGNLFIGIAPVLFGITAIIFLTNWLMEANVILTLPAEKSAFWPAMKYICTSLWEMTLQLFSPEVLFRWQSIVWLVCLILIGSHISLSPEDLKGADTGFEALVEAIVLYHFVMVKFFPLPHVLVRSCGHFLLQSFYFMVLSLALMLIILTSVYLCRCLVRFFKYRNGSLRTRFRAIFAGNVGVNQNIEENDLLLEAACAAIERKDPAAAFQHLQTAALQYGFPSEQYSLGLHYLYGYGTEADPEKSEHFLLLAAGQGYKPAQNRLWQEYFAGENFKQDHKKAFKWLKEADDGTNLEVCQMLGECYECGLGVRKNPAKAFQYYKQAFDLDPDDSFLRLLMGECYCEGTGVKQNYDLAIEYLTPIKDELDAAKIALGKCYLFGKKDAYTSALLFNQVTTEAFKEEADELLDQAVAQLPDDQLQKLLSFVESPDKNAYEAECKKTASGTEKHTSSTGNSFSFSNVPSAVNISVSTTYSKK